VVRAVPIDELDEFDPRNGLRPDMNLDVRSHTNLLNNPAMLPVFLFAQKIQPIYRSLWVIALEGQILVIIACISYRRGQGK
jgi:hypothetical protein